MASAKYVVGIDLGTTNTVVSFAPIQKDATVNLFPIKQMVGEEQVGESRALPSVAFLESSQEGTPRCALSWSNEGLLVGQLARSLASSHSQACVQSAKSWLSYAGVDRRGAILPWGGSSEGAKYSPIQISSAFLSHIRCAWDESFPGEQLCEQEVVLTVPASFDDTARRLTVEAARLAGLSGPLFLIEEPQAAFYDQVNGCAESLRAGSLVLVVDVGGGTTDLTLIRCGGEGAEQSERFERVAVGEHLLLGGDNMDLLLAYEAERRILGRNGSLNTRVMSQLVSNCRDVKERSFASDALDSYTVSLPSRGSRLVQGTRSCSFTRNEVVALLTSAFVPPVGFDSEVKRARGMALSALGLPYEQEPLLTKHVAAFLRRHAHQGFPSHVLFNGGVFRGDALKRALFNVLNSWSEAAGHTLTVLLDTDLDASVARGAAVYGLSRHGLGERIGGGVSSNYFVSVERRNKKGRRKGRAGFCILPKGTRNNERLHLESQVFNLVAGRPIQMTVLCGGLDAIELGVAKAEAWDDYQSLPPVQTVVDAHEDAQHVPVTLSACMSELGLLELWAHATDRSDLYHFEFKGTSDQLAQVPAGESAHLEAKGDFGAIEAHLLSVFGKPDPNADPKEIKRLFRTLEGLVGAPRDGWGLGTLRRVFDLLIKSAKRRRRSERHEMSFLYLAGFCLRPGLGDSFDEWRVKRLWELFDEGVHFHQRLENWDAWWIAWRRIAGGLDAGSQGVLFERLSPWLMRVLDGKTTKKDRLRQPTEGLRLLAGLERVEPKDKQVWGDRFMSMIEGSEDVRLASWCLARIGAREMVYGGAEGVIDARIVQGWLARLLLVDWGAGFMIQHCVVSLARCTGDRERDLDPAFRMKIAQRLSTEGVEVGMINSVENPTELRIEETHRLLGDTLPDGLRMMI
jgi:hypothetical protein